ncbi:MAG: SusD/RagB family nutrient-binding outer membrane lipoprotein [Balneolaceae bacterium]|nr:SusD/RagB family nutrient-binding outer membrane lipoprotein [Balneolaceae bacterium]
MTTQHNLNPFKRMLSPNQKTMKNIRNWAAMLLLTGLVASCTDGYDTVNTNPNQPTEVGSEALVPSAVRSSVNAHANMSYLVGNNITQLTAKTLRREVDLYQWNSFNNFVWDPLYETLRDVESLHTQALAEGNTAAQGVALVLRSWVYSTLTDAYGDIPYTEAIGADDDVLFPAYDTQEDIYLGPNGLIATLDEAAGLLASSSNTLNGDILYGGDTEKWERLANALQLRMWLRVSDKVPSQAASGLQALYSEGRLMTDVSDGGLLTYLSTAPNQFPTFPLKIGDFDAVNISARAVDSLSNWNDPRLEIYARPANAPLAADETPNYAGFENGALEGGGSRLGYRYYNYPGHATSQEMAKGIIMTHAEQEFILAEAAQRGMISGDAKAHYNAGVLSSMLQYSAETLFPYTSVNGETFATPADYLAQASVDFDSAEDKLNRIAAQKWVALYFTGLEPWFDWRRTGLPAFEPSINNENGDVVPVRFRYPGDELTLNTANYQAAVSRIGGDNINNAMWLVQD